MQPKNKARCLVGLCIGVLLPSLGWGQSVGSSLSGTVTDPSGAAVPSAEVTVTAIETGVKAKFTTGPDGLYSFPNLQAGSYELKVSAKGFRDYVQRGISVRLSASVRQDVKLELGAAVQTIEVSANASPLNFENAEHKEGISPETIKELPLLLGGAIRSSGNFVTLLPGVTQGAGDATSVHVNGAQQYSGAVVLDGISLVNPSGGNGIFSAILDFPQSPDIISELQALTSDYSAQYGEAAGFTMIMSIRSGSNQFHGTLFEFTRNTALNARQFGTDNRSKDIEHDFGGNIGGPLKLPGIWGPRHKTFFFTNFEDFRIAGSLTRSTLSIPSLKERQGDFSDWPFPVYDPATTRPNPNFDASQNVSPNNLPYLRDQFMGCDGKTPNVICSSDPRLQGSLAPQWFQFLPNPSSPGPLNNYLAPPTPAGFLNSNAYTLTWKIDEYIGDKNHVSASWYYKNVAPTTFTHLPAPISSDGLSYKRTLIERLVYDRIISPTLLNHVAFGYNNDGFWGGGIDGPYANKLPQIPGVASHRYPPQMTFSDGFNSFGSGAGFAKEQPWPAPAYVVNDMVTLIKGAHSFNFGGEYRNLGNTYHTRSGESGIFSFARGETGLLGLDSGSPIASFLLEQVDSGTASFRSVEDVYGRNDSAALFFGDKWKATRKLTVNYGVRWEMYRPPVEKWNHFSFLDPLEPNPEAGGRLGALAFAGSGPGKCNCRHPEETWHRGFAPRLGLAYAVSNRSVVRAGYGIFYDMGNMPGWDSGIAQDGYDVSPAFSSTNGGLTTAFLLSQGLPQNFQRPPLLVPGFDNGQGGPIYRPLDANRLPYSQQWNLTLDHQFTNNLYVSGSYVGSKGTRLLSQVAEINALDPKYLSMGQPLFDQFQPGQTMLDGVPLPYAGWVEQLSACAPSVAQALLPYPQYCGGLFGRDENVGNSTYHSFQVKAEHRFSQGFWLLGAYTLSKLITDADNNQSQSLTWSGASGVISPFERKGNKSLAVEDIPQALAISLVYELPFGKGKRWHGTGGLWDRLIGGWTLSNVFRAESGIPFYIRSGTCNVPGPFRVSCLPALLPGKNPFAQSKGGGFDPNRPLLDVNAFESPNSFNFYAGQGPRVSNVREPGYTNQDVALEKKIAVTERAAFHLRAEFFNIWNWHHLNCVGLTSCGPASLAFVNDVASPSFGFWNGTVTNPRNIQVSARFTF